MAHWTRFLKDWALAVSMLTGVLVYMVMHLTQGLDALKPQLNAATEWLMPVCLFGMLFFTFCKMDPKELRLRRWFGILLAVQAVGTVLLAVLAAQTAPGPGKLLLEGGMMMLICPTAAAAPVIVGKLGGNDAAATSYVMLSNVMAAIGIPMVFPLVVKMGAATFWMQVVTIVGHIFPLLILPLVLAWLIRWLWPSANRWLVKYFHAAPFYIWAFNLIMLTGEACRKVVNSQSGAFTIVGMALVGLLVCVVQFYIGRKVGTHYGEKVCAGQALGQKNNVFAVWAACAYLPGITSLAPCSYIVWQNLFNSWELSKRKNREG